jgi:hypothetical protein
MKTILSHANLIDCVEPQVRPDTAVLIEDGRIRAILPKRTGPVAVAAVPRPNFARMPRSVWLGLH